MPLLVFFILPFLFVYFQHIICTFIMGNWYKHISDLEPFCFLFCSSPDSLPKSTEPSPPRIGHPLSPAKWTFASHPLIEPPLSIDFSFDINGILISYISIDENTYYFYTFVNIPTSRSQYDSFESPVTILSTYF